MKLEIASANSNHLRDGTETLFGSLKVERLHGMRFSTRRATMH